MLRWPALLFLSVVSVFGAALADPLTLGFPQANEHANFLQSSELLPRFLSAALTASLAASDPTSSRAQFNVSDATKTSSDYSSWSYRIRADAEFSSGDSITQTDVVFSLRRCGTSHIIPGFVDATADTRTDDDSQWVNLRVSVANSASAQAVARAVSECPIIQSRTSLLFAGELGLGSNVVSSGPYVISTFSAGRKYILTRVHRGSRDRTGAEALELRSFASPEQALSALRVGTIAAYIAQDQSLLERAQSDSTLAVVRCSSYWIIRRKSVAIECLEKLSVVDISDDS